MKTIIGLLACQAYPERRDLCRQTWLPVIQSLGIDVVFLIGGHHCVERIDDELLLPVPDNYPSLPQKTKAFCGWALESDATHLFKADDDTFIHPQRFEDWLANITTQDYVGNEWTAHKGYASGGAGYLLSRKSACLVTTMKKKVGAEDLEVAKILKCNKIPLHMDHRFIGFGNEVKRPLPDNDLITTHKISVDLWNDTWAQCGEPK